MATHGVDTGGAGRRRPSRRAALGVIAGAAGLPVTVPASAKRSAEVAKAEALPTVTLVSGAPGDSCLDMAHDLAVALGNDRLRVLALVGAGGERNLFDVLGLRGVDMAVVTTLDMRRAEASSLAGRLVYLSKLHTAELHVLAGPGVEHLTDLDGKVVSLGEAGGSTAPVAKAVLDHYGIRHKDRPMPLRGALAAMRAEGGPAATFLLSGQPAPLPADALRGSGLRLLALPYDPGLGDLLYPASLLPESYPGLADGPVDTVAVAKALVAFDWTQPSPRLTRLTGFAKAYAAGLPRLRTPGHHPKWLEVNAATDIPGWRRFAPMEEALRKGAWRAQGAPGAREGR